MPVIRKLIAALLAAPLMLCAETQAGAQGANDGQSVLLCKLPGFFRHWEEKAEPQTIIPKRLHYVGTKGLGVFVIETSNGLIQMNTGMPSSGPMIEQSLKQLRLDPKAVRLIFVSHAHCDHAGAVAFIKQRTGAKLMIMQADAQAMASGGIDDDAYGKLGRGMHFRGARVNRKLRDRDKIKHGDVTIEALHTPGHTRGAASFVAAIPDGKRTLRVLFADGVDFNPLYRLAVNPTYDGIARDFSCSLRRLETLDPKPDIWLVWHNEAAAYKFAEKIARAKAKDFMAWQDPDGFAAYLAGQRRKLDRRLNLAGFAGLAARTAARDHPCPAR
jgi:metallo-beta-lactamase class B